MRPYNALIRERVHLLMLRTCILLLLNIIIITYITYSINVYRLMFWSRLIVYYNNDYRSRSAASLFIFRIINIRMLTILYFASPVRSLYALSTYLLNLLLLLVYCATCALYYGGALSRAACVIFSEGNSKRVAPSDRSENPHKKKTAVDCHRVYLQILIIRIYRLCSPCLRAEHLNY